MRSQNILFFAVVSFVLSSLACGGATPVNTVTSNVSRTANSNTTNPLETKKSEPEKVTNNGPTLTPVFKAFCDAWTKNDEAALRKVYSQDTIKSFESQMKQEKATSLVKFLQGTDKVSGTPCDVTNEKIDGDKAVATIHSDRYPKGIEVVFVKENNEWKMTNRSPAIDNMKPSANANAAK